MKLIVFFHETQNLKPNRSTILHQPTNCKHTYCLSHAFHSKLIVGCEVHEFKGRHKYELNLSGNVVLPGFMTPLCT